MAIVDATALEQEVENEQTPRSRWGGLCQIATDSVSDQSSVSMEDASPLGQEIEGDNRLQGPHEAASVS